MGYLGTPLSLATSEPDSTNFIKGDFEGQNWNTNWTFIVGLSNISMSQDFTTKASGILLYYCYYIFYLFIFYFYIVVVLIQ